jgi:hypothetical protein
MKHGDTIRQDLISIGVVLMVFGALITFITFGVGIVCTWPIIGVGFILLLLGAVINHEGTGYNVQQQKPVIIQQAPQKTRNCPSCGRQIPFDAIICPYCKNDFEKTP